jgi:hypothetical protein
VIVTLPVPLIVSPSITAAAPDTVPATLKDATSLIKRDTEAPSAGSKTYLLLADVTVTVPYAESTVYAPAPSSLTPNTAPESVLVVATVVVVVVVVVVSVVVLVVSVVEVTEVSTGASAAGFTEAVVSVCFVSSVSDATVAVDAATNLMGLVSPNTCTVPAEIRETSSVASASVSTSTEIVLVAEFATIVGISFICDRLILIPDATSTRVIPVRSAFVASSVPSVTLRVVNPEVALPAARVTVSPASAKSNSSTPVPVALSFISYALELAFATSNFAEELSDTVKPVTDEAEYVSPDLVRVNTFDEVVLELPLPQADKIRARGVVPSAAAFLLLLSF